MHYILLHHSFEKLAGTERVLYNIVEYLAERRDGRITLILASGERDLALPIDQFGIEIVFLKVDLKGVSFIHTIDFHIKLYMKLLGFLNRIAGSERMLCIATNPMLASLAYYAGRKKPTGSFSVISCEHFALEVSGRLSKLLRKILYKNVSVVALTKRDQTAIQAKYKPRICVCIPNAIPFELKPYDYNVNKRTILAIGRLTEQKGFDLLIRAFALIADKHPLWELKIVGDDYGDKSKLYNLMKELQVSQVSILPATKLIEEHYQRSAFFALSSRFEGLPMVVLEAMGYGLPVVAFDCPTGPAELVDSSSGYLVQNGNVGEFAAAMDRLISNTNLLINKAKGAEQKAQAFRKENINKLWASLFNQLTH